MEVTFRNINIRTESCWERSNYLEALGKNKPW